MDIAVAGTGYVGLSLAVLLAQHHKVTAVDIVPERVELLNRKKSPIVDREIENYLANRDLNLVATTDTAGYAGADCVIIATPTNYIPENNSSDTTSIEAVLDRLPTAEIVERDETGWTVEAEVFGRGIEMWLQSQGSYIS